MRKLFSAGFTRLWKDTVFRTMIFLMILSALVFSWFNFQTSLKYDGKVYYVEDVLFNLLPMMIIICCVQISLFLGIEFDDNTIRNKLIVGHTRTAIYFADYFTCLAASSVLLTALLLFSGIAGWLLFHEFLLDKMQLLFLLFCSYLAVAVISAICVAIGMNSQSRVKALIFSFVLMLGMLFLGSYLQSALLEAEKVYENIVITMEGVQFGELVENPAYIGGPLRKVYEFLYDLFPTGQAIQLNNMEFERCARWPLLSMLMLLLITPVGWLGFSRKNIR